MDFHCATICAGLVPLNRYIHIYLPVGGQNKVAISFTSNHLRVIVVHKDTLCIHHNTLMMDLSVANLYTFEACQHLSMFVYIQDTFPSIIKHLQLFRLHLPCVDITISLYDNIENTAFFCMTIQQWLHKER